MVSFLLDNKGNPVVTNRYCIKRLSIRVGRYIYLSVKITLDVGTA